MTLNEYLAHNHLRASSIAWQSLTLQDFPSPNDMEITEKGDEVLVSDSNSTYKVIFSKGDYLASVEKLN